jgi:hypothetical protein
MVELFTFVTHYETGVIKILMKFLNSAKRVRKYIKPNEKLQHIPCPVML